jgi:hypothetical protein
MEVVKYGRSEIVLPHIEDNLDPVDDLGCGESLSDYLRATPVAASFSAPTSTWNPVRAASPPRRIPGYQTTLA